MPQQVWDGCKTFYFPGGSIGVLLVHGYIGTPDEVKRMGEDFAQRGYTVLGVRLFGHATHPGDLGRARWEDWLADIEDGLNILSATCETIVIAGLSMGGVLSLLAGATYPQIKAIVAMSTPIDFSPRAVFAPLHFLCRFLPKIHPLRYVSLLSKERQKIISQTIQQSIGYHEIVPRSYTELYQLVQNTRAAVPGIQQPTLVIHSKQDNVVPFKNGPMLYEMLNCPIKQQLWLENSQHAIIDGAERFLVYETAHHFIQQALKG
jgi:carboxylesterase